MGFSAHAKAIIMDRSCHCSAMAFYARIFLCLSLVSADIYTKPPCGPDEKEVSIQGNAGGPSGSICTKQCGGGGSGCPAAPNSSHPTTTSGCIVCDPSMQGLACTGGGTICNSSHRR